MTFVVKTTGATYQWMVNNGFHKQIGRNVEAYAYDKVIKIKHRNTHFVDLTETFETLSKNNLKLNPTKCTFGVKLRKFLGFMITERGIEANLEKIQEIQNLVEPVASKT